MVTAALAAIHQLGYVVTDIHAAIAFWNRHLGVGPFTLTEKFVMKGLSYRGAPSPAVLSIATSYFNDMQVELIQQHDHSPSVYLDFLEFRPEGGLHHFGLMTEGFQSECDRLRANGYEVVQEGVSRRDPSTRYAYLALAGSSPAAYSSGPMLEIIGDSELKRQEYAVLKQKIAAWNGKDATVAYHNKF